VRAFLNFEVSDLRQLPRLFTSRLRSKVAQLLRLSLVWGVLLAAQGASASFHLIVIKEVYSNSSGNVQYVVLQALTGGQQFLNNHSITSTQAGSTHTFTFPNNLPGDTSNRKVLIASQGFADLGIVTPDYIVPNGFLFQTGGTVNYAGVDIMAYTALPSDGIHALDRNGSAVATAPTNFAGATGSIADCLFNWAERTYPQFFAPAGAASAALPPYYYRFYAGTQNYVATSAADDQVYVLGPMSGNAIQPVGSFATFLPISGCSP
jgi:hypothetical protein